MRVAKLWTSLGKSIDLEKSRYSAYFDYYYCYHYYYFSIHFICFFLLCLFVCAVTTLYSIHSIVIETMFNKFELNFNEIQKKSSCNVPVYASVQWLYKYEGTSMDLFKWVWWNITNDNKKNPVNVGIHFCYMVHNIQRKTIIQMQNIHSFIHCVYDVCVESRNFFLFY